MKSPDAVRQALVRRFQSKHREWLINPADAAQWPLEITLGIPTEQAALQQVEGVRAWVNAWQNWQGNGTLIWCERRWQSLGVQRLPEKLAFSSPQEVATWIGEATRWVRARSRYQTLTSRWPALMLPLPKYFDVLADYSDADYQRLVDMLAWLHGNPNSNVYPRQIPIAGADSKWLESRKGLIAELMAWLQPDTTTESDFYKRCGLRSQPKLVRMLVLDPALRARLGDLRDISAPYEEIAALDIRPTHALIVENLQTGLAFDDMPGTVVIMRLGYAVDVLGQIPWLKQARCSYWGDIDTHGFAILNRARKYLPQLQSVLMDEATLLSHRDLWVKEQDQHAATTLPLLTSPEQALYQTIKSNTCGQQVRLEQERIRWDVAWKAIEAALR